MKLPSWLNYTSTPCPTNVAFGKDVKVDSQLINQYMPIRHYCGPGK
jgi:hypothetical protein